MIILMRHAQTVGGKGRCIGRTPLPLSDIGKMQAKRMAEAFMNIPFQRICCSPSQRALDTLAPLTDKRDQTAEIHPHLDEIDMGEWDGLPFDDIQQEHPDEYAKRGCDFSGFRPPGGESFFDVAERAMDFMNLLAHGPRPVLAITHAGFIRSITCRLMNQNLDDLFQFEPAHASMTLIQLTVSGLEIVDTNVPPEQIANYVK